MRPRHRDATRRARFLVLVVAAAATSAAGCRIVVQPEEPSLEDAVEQMLERSAAAWNEGDLEGFLSDYADSPATTYIGGGGLLEGIDAIRAVYAPAFAPGAARDSLRFEAVRTRSLAPTLGIVTARWVLHQEDSVTASGPFTLVVRRSGSGWKILHDHSSSDAPAAGAGSSSDSGGEPAGAGGDAEEAGASGEAGAPE
ncbi:MAG: SgcJ/EcaC family oxidoreductase [Gemmatimonadota bacterium]|nr:SgcJ/EcaC family oxidoreductase [Gemmatimonadota bacterium]